MFGKILKGIAVAAGVGFAIGMGVGRAGAVRRRRPGEDHAPRNASDEFLALERIGRIESRLTAVESRRPAAADSDAVARLNLRIEQQAKDIEALRLQMNEYRQWIANDIAGIEKRLADVTRGMPAVLESIIVPRVDDLRLRLRAETQQSLNSTLTTFERTIDDRISDRIATIEKAMLDQSALVTALSHRAIESDMNLQRLIAAVERFCERSGGNQDVLAPAAVELQTEVSAA